MKKILLALLLVLSRPALADTLSLTTANTVNFRGVVDGESTTAAMLELTDLVKTRGKATYPIYLVLDSPGGSVDAGLSFIAYVKTLPNVQTISIFAASMASGIVEGLPGRRYVTKNGILMFHRAKGGLQGQFEEGELESELAFFKTVVRSMEQVSADRIGISLGEYKAKVKDEWWMYGPQAVDQRAADELADLVCSPQLIDARKIASFDTIFGPVKLMYSGCPLLRSPLPQEEKEENHGN